MIQMNVFLIAPYELDLEKSLNSSNCILLFNFEDFTSENKNLSKKRSAKTFSNTEKPIIGGNTVLTPVEQNQVSTREIYCT